MPEIRRHGVCNASLEIAPNKLIRVEFRGVTRETMQLQTGSRPQKFAHEDAAMLIDVVTHDEHWATKTFEQQA